LRPKKAAGENTRPQLAKYWKLRGGEPWASAAGPYRRRATGILPVPEHGQDGHGTRGCGTGTQPVIDAAKTCTDFMGRGGMKKTVTSDERREKIYHHSAISFQQEPGRPAGRKLIDDHGLLKC
jgi:hypothetical protein